MNLSSNEESTSSSVMCAKSSGTFPLTSEPELTTMSTPPNSAATESTIAATDAGSFSSTCAGISSSAAPGTSSEAMASFARRTLRLHTAVRTPSSASCLAIAIPMPPVPPVTIARLPASARSIGRVPPNSLNDARAR